jgi:hypothetical protein
MRRWRAIHAIASHTGAQRLADIGPAGQAFAWRFHPEARIAQDHRLARREGLDLHSYHPTGGGADLRCRR